jgi:heme-degrading monooxygenase HmoA
MFARMTTITIKPGEIDRAIATFRKSVLPAAKTQRGFRGACLMVDRPSGKGIAVTFWPSEKTASVNENNLYYQAQLIKFLDQFAAPPIRQGFEVCVHEWKPGPARPCGRTFRPRRPVH